MAPLENRSMLADQCKRPLLQPKLGAFLDPDFRALGRTPVGGEHRHVGIDPECVIAPVAGGDHSAVEIQDPGKFPTVKGGDWAPVPVPRERRDDTQALLTFGCG